MKKGFRPHINIDSIPIESYQPYVLRVKVRPNVIDAFKGQHHNKDKNGNIQTGRKQIDSTLTRVRAKHSKRNIEDFYDQAGNNRKQRRHEEYGFHLWQEITLEPGTDIIDAIKQLRSLPDIEIVEPVYRKKRTFTPQDDWFVQGWQWALKNIGQLDIDYEGYGQTGTPGWDMNMQGAWNLTGGASDVIVAVFDEGIDYDHVDIAANMWAGIGPQGTATVAGDHGTHVAGTLGAVNNSIGMTGIAGGNLVIPGVKIMSLDIFSETQTLTTEQLYIYAADNGAAISQNSWGYIDPNVYNQADLDGIDYFNEFGGGTQMEGGICIFAAGNDNSEEAWYPAYYGHNDDSVMGAMAVAAFDNRGAKASFSNYGAWVDIAAPGVYILSILPENDGGWMSGTSQACPHVSGVAALILSQLKYKITNDELWELLVKTGRDLNATNPLYINKLGKALDATSALYLANSLQTPELLLRGNKMLIRGNSFSSKK